jgi:miniconductance mechanosensitive channel
MTLIVRQLKPGPEGLPMEIYAFSNDTNWVNYEGFQSDIFDHLLAMIPEFGLKVFQSPTGEDVRAVGMALGKEGKPRISGG